MAWWDHEELKDPKYRSDKYLVSFPDEYTKDEVAAAQRRLDKQGTPNGKQDMSDRKIIDLLSAPLSDEDMEFLLEKGFALYKEYRRGPGVRGTTILKEDGIDYWVAVATKYLLLSRITSGQGKQESGEKT